MTAQLQLVQGIRSAPGTSWARIGTTNPRGAPLRHTPVPQQTALLHSHVSACPTLPSPPHQPSSTLRLIPQSTHQYVPLRNLLDNRPPSPLRSTPPSRVLRLLLSSAPAVLSLPLALSAVASPLPPSIPAQLTGSAVALSPPSLDLSSAVEGASSAWSGAVAGLESVADSILSIPVFDSWDALTAPVLPSLFAVPQSLISPPTNGQVTGAISGAVSAALSPIESAWSSIQISPDAPLESALFYASLLILLAGLTLQPRQ